MTRIATFLACDEVGPVGLGKFAYVGVYGGDLLVPKIPYTLPQLFFIVRFRTPIDDRSKKFRVRIERPGFEPFRPELPDVSSEPPTRNPDANFFQHQAILRIAPFEVREVGIVRVFVEDENGDNYAGGLRLKIGTHPDMAMPQVAHTASLIVAQYERVSSNDQREIAPQLIEAMSSLMRHVGQPARLQFPNADIRILLDDKSVQVFFPEPLEFSPTIKLLSQNEDYQIEVATIDRFGFIARFYPSAPEELNFEYVLSGGDEGKAPPTKRRSKKPSA